jgi:hypothetical protein
MGSYHRKEPLHPSTALHLNRPGRPTSSPALPPRAHGRGVLRVMAVGVEPQATSRSRLTPEGALGLAADEVEEPGVDLVPPPQDLCQVCGARFSPHDNPTERYGLRGPRISGGARRRRPEGARRRGGAAEEEDLLVAWQGDRGGSEVEDTGEGGVAGEGEHAVGGRPASARHPSQRAQRVHRAAWVGRLPRGRVLRRPRCPGWTPTGAATSPPTRQSRRPVGAGLGRPVGMDEARTSGGAAASHSDLTSRRRATPATAASAAVASRTVAIR